MLQAHLRSVAGLGAGSSPNRQRPSSRALHCANAGVEWASRLPRVTGRTLPYDELRHARASCCNSWPVVAWGQHWRPAGPATSTGPGTGAGRGHGSSTNRCNC
eukprot:6899308-Alexandrium_andersonii.AAC.1